MIVHLRQTSVSFSLIVKLEVTISAGLRSSAIKNNFCGLDFVASVLEVVIEVKIEEAFLREVADIERGELVHSFLSLLLVSMTASASWLVNIKKLELVHDHVALILLLGCLHWLRISHRIHSDRWSNCHSWHHLRGTHHHCLRWDHSRSGHNHLGLHRSLEHLLI